VPGEPVRRLLFRFLFSLLFPLSPRCARARVCGSGRNVCLFVCLRELGLQEAASAMESRFWTHQVSVIFPLSHTPRCEILKSLLSVLKSGGSECVIVACCRIVGFAGLVILQIIL